MKRTNQCPKCGSNDIIADAKAIDYSPRGISELTVATYKKPEALLLKGERKTTLSAWVCVDCGFVEYYADHPREIKIEEE